MVKINILNNSKYILLAIIIIIIVLVCLQPLMADSDCNFNNDSMSSIIINGNTVYSGKIHECHANGSFHLGSMILKDMDESNISTLYLYGEIRLLDNKEDKIKVDKLIIPNYESSQFNEPEIIVQHHTFKGDGTGDALHISGMDNQAYGVVLRDESTRKNHATFYLGASTADNYRINEVILQASSSAQYSVYVNCDGPTEACTQLSGTKFTNYASLTDFLKIKYIGDSGKIIYFGDPNNTQRSGAEATSYYDVVRLYTSGAQKLYFKMPYVADISDADIILNQYFLLSSALSLDTIGRVEDGGNLIVKSNFLSNNIQIKTLYAEDASITLIDDYSFSSLRLLSGENGVYFFKTGNISVSTIEGEGDVIIDYADNMVVESDSFKVGDLDLRNLGANKTLKIKTINEVEKIIFNGDNDQTLEIVDSQNVVTAGSVLGKGKIVFYGNKQFDIPIISKNVTFYSVDGTFVIDDLVLEQSLENMQANYQQTGSDAKATINQLKDDAILSVLGGSLTLTGKAYKLSSVMLDNNGKLTIDDTVESMNLHQLTSSNDSVIEILSDTIAIKIDEKTNAFKIAKLDSAIDLDFTGFTNANNTIDGLQFLSDNRILTLDQQAVMEIDTLGNDYTHIMNLLLKDGSQLTVKTVSYAFDKLEIYNSTLSADSLVRASTVILHGDNSASLSEVNLKSFNADTVDMSHASLIVEGNIDIALDVNLANTSKIETNKLTANSVSVLTDSVLIVNQQLQATSIVVDDSEFVIGQSVYNGTTGINIDVKNNSKFSLNNGTLEYNQLNFENLSDQIIINQVLFKGDGSNFVVNHVNNLNITKFLMIDQATIEDSQITTDTLSNEGLLTIHQSTINVKNISNEDTAWHASGFDLQNVKLDINGNVAKFYNNQDQAGSIANASAVMIHEGDVDLFDLVIDGTLVGNQHASLTVDGNYKATTDQEEVTDDSDYITTQILNQAIFDIKSSLNIELQGSFDILEIDNSTFNLSGNLFVTRKLQIENNAIIDITGDITAYEVMIMNNATFTASQNFVVDTMLKIESTSGVKSEVGLYNLTANQFIISYADVMVQENIVINDEIKLNNQSSLTAKEITKNNMTYSHDDNQLISIEVDNSKLQVNETLIIDELNVLNSSTGDGFGVNVGGYADINNLNINDSSLVLRSSSDLRTLSAVNSEITFGDAKNIDAFELNVSNSFDVTNSEIAIYNKMTANNDVALNFVGNQLVVFKGSTQLNVVKFTNNADVLINNSFSANSIILSGDNRINVIDAELRSNSIIGDTGDYINIDSDSVLDMFGNASIIINSGELNDPGLAVHGKMTNLHSLEVYNGVAFFASDVSLVNSLWLETAVDQANKITTLSVNSELSVNNATVVNADLNAKSLTVGNTLCLVGDAKSCENQQQGNSGLSSTATVEGDVSIDSDLIMENSMFTIGGALDLTGIGDIVLYGIADAKGYSSVLNVAGQINVHNLDVNGSQLLSDNIISSGDIHIMDSNITVTKNISATNINIEDSVLEVINGDINVVDKLMVSNSEVTVTKEIHANEFYLMNTVFDHHENINDNDMSMYLYDSSLSLNNKSLSVNNLEVENSTITGINNLTVNKLTLLDSDVTVASDIQIEYISIIAKDKEATLTVNGKLSSVIDNLVMDGGTFVGSGELNINHFVFSNNASLVGMHNLSINDSLTIYNDKLILENFESNNSVLRIDITGNEDSQLNNGLFAENVKISHSIIEPILDSTAYITYDAGFLDPVIYTIIESSNQISLSDITYDEHFPVWFEYKFSENIVNDDTGNYQLNISIVRLYHYDALLDASKYNNDTDLYVLADTLDTHVNKNLLTDNLVKLVNELDKTANDCNPDMGGYNAACDDFGRSLSTLVPNDNISLIQNIHANTLAIANLLDDEFILYATHSLEYDEQMLGVEYASYNDVWIKTGGHLSNNSSFVADNGSLVDEMQHSSANVLVGYNILNDYTRDFSKSRILSIFGGIGGGVMSNAVSDDNLQALYASVGSNFIYSYNSYNINLLSVLDVGLFRSQRVDFMNSINESTLINNELFGQFQITKDIWLAENPVLAKVLPGLLRKFTEASSNLVYKPGFYINASVIQSSGYDEDGSVSSQTIDPWLAQTIELGFTQRLITDIQINDKMVLPYIDWDISQRQFNNVATTSRFLNVEDDAYTMITGPENLSYLNNRFAVGLDLLASTWSLKMSYAFEISQYETDHFIELGLNFKF